MNSERISPFWVNGYQPFSAAVTNVILRKFQGGLSRDQQHEKNKLCT